MILVVCPSCRLCIRVMGDVEEINRLVGPDSDFWPDKFPCPSCEKPSYGILESEVDPREVNILRLVDLDPSQAFAAFHGLGLPEELNCTVGALTELLSQHSVRRVIGRNIIGTTRCTLDRLEMDDGSKIYFAAGADGACVYRIVKPHSYVENIDGGA